MFYGCVSFYWVRGRMKEGKGKGGEGRKGKGIDGTRTR
jgi:hypothetical protein